MHRRLAFGMIVSLSLLTTACGHKATGQTVAVVNGEEITASDLNAELAAANLPPSVDKDAARAQILQTIINRRLFAQKARDEGLDKSPQFLAKRRQMEEQLLIGLSAEKRGSTTQLPDQQKIDQFIAANPGMFKNREVLSLQQLAFVPPADAQTILGGLKNAHSLDEVASVLTKANVQFQRGDSKVDSASLPPEVLKQVEALPKGEPFIVPANGQMIASVIVGREPNPTSAEDSNRVALQAIRRQQVTEGVEGELKQLRDKAKIEYQPGYAPKDNDAKAGAKKT